MQYYTPIVLPFPNVVYVATTGSVGQHVLHPIEQGAPSTTTTTTTTTNQQHAVAPTETVSSAIPDMTNQQLGAPAATISSQLPDPARSGGGGGDGGDDGGGGREVAIRAIEAVNTRMPDGVVSSEIKVEQEMKNSPEMSADSQDELSSTTEKTTHGTAVAYHAPQTVQNAMNQQLPLPPVPIQAVPDQESLPAAKGKTKSSTLKVENAVKGKRGVGPLRPLSAYNIFFFDERASLLGEPVSGEELEAFVRSRYSGKVRPKRKRRRRNPGEFGFSGLAKIIANRWTMVRDTEYSEKYLRLATLSMSLYREACRTFNTKQTSSTASFAYEANSETWNPGHLPHDQE